MQEMKLRYVQGFGANKKGIALKPSPNTGQNAAQTRMMLKKIANEMYYGNSTKFGGTINEVSTGGGDGVLFQSNNYDKNKKRAKEVAREYRKRKRIRKSKT